MILFYVYFPCNYLCCMIGTYYLPFPMREVQPASPLGMAIGWGRSKRWGVHPYLAWFCFTSFPPCPTPHDGKNFLAPSSLLGVPRNPVSPRKTLLFVNLPTIIAIVFNKTCFINKNILEIKNKFIPSNQTNF